jgi:hypothetical protein
LRPWFIVFVLAVVLVFFGLGTAILGDPFSLPALLSSLPVLAIVIVVVLFWGTLIVWLLPIGMARLLWRGNPLLRSPHEALLLPAGMNVRTSYGESTIHWAAFDAVLDGGRTYLLHLRGRRPAYVLIPKQAMSGPNGGAELGELLRRFVRADASA